jgi:hypothetical protein
MQAVERRRLVPQLNRSENNQAGYQKNRKGKTHCQKKQVKIKTNQYNYLSKFFVSLY